MYNMQRTLYYYIKIHHVINHLTEEKQPFKMINNNITNTCIIFNSIILCIGILIIGSRDPMIGEDNQAFHLLDNYMSVSLQHV